METLAKLEDTASTVSLGLVLVVSVCCSVVSVVFSSVRPIVRKEEVSKANMSSKLLECACGENETNIKLQRCVCQAKR